MTETVFTTDMTHSNFADTTNYSIEQVWGGPCDHHNCKGDCVAFITINFADGGSVGGYFCRQHLDEYEVAYGLPRSTDVPTGRTGEDHLDTERDHTSGGVPVAARSTIRPSDCLSLVLSGVATDEREARGILTAKAHKPDAKRVGSHCRVDCTCGWKGPQVSMFGHGHQPWAEHFEAVR